VTESWNGTAWTEVNDLNEGRQETSGFGVATSAICGGGTSPIVADVESWNGTSWTEIAEMTTTATLRTGAGSSNTEGLFAGGTTDGGSTVTANCEQWDGSSWTEVTNITTARFGGGGTSGGTASFSAICSGGHPPRLVNTEEWDLSHPIKTVTTS
jgi:hypothetical protein